MSFYIISNSSFRHILILLLVGILHTFIYNPAAILSISRRDSNSINRITSHKYQRVHRPPYTHPEDEPEKNNNKSKENNHSFKNSCCAPELTISLEAKNKRFLLLSFYSFGRPKIRKKKSFQNLNSISFLITFSISLRLSRRKSVEVRGKFPI